MSTVVLEIPEAFVKSFGSTNEEAAQNAKLELAIAMYREGKWSTGKAAEFAGVYLGALIDLLRERGISRPYTAKMLEQDMNYASGGR
jgi:predicted HTH domain antitoxin